MLADLDELILKCRNDRARSYIAEAVGCYRSGAYRSAIVATWVAVCYDILDKLRELSLAGDKGAEKVLETFDNARRSNDLPKTLKLERELVDIARDRFELMSHVEHVDLARLREDRNRCAHPSLISDDAIFTASAELARAHIRTAVTHLLEHPPVQGKFALERLQRAVASDYFPTSTEEARKSLSVGPLKRPRESLVSNFIVILLKSLLGDQKDAKPTAQLLAALAATQKLHPQTFEVVLKDKVSLIAQKVEDQNLFRMLRVLLRIKDVWSCLASDVQNRLENYVLNLPAVHLHYLEDLLESPSLATQARSRLKRATMKELDDCFFFSLHELIAERFIQHYLESNNYAAANERSRILITYASDLSEGQQRRMIAGIDSNAQIRGSYEASKLLSALRKTNVIAQDEFDNLLHACGLDGLRSQED